MYPGTADVLPRMKPFAVNSHIAFYAFLPFCGIEPVVALTCSPLDALGVERFMTEGVADCLRLRRIFMMSFFYAVAPDSRLSSILWKYQ